MLEAMTPQEIKGRILARLEGTLETREGSVMDTVMGPTALELSQVDEGMDLFFSLAFPDEGSGPFLDIEGNKYDIRRKEGQKAGGTITLEGTPGTEIAAGTTFYTARELGYTLEKTVTLDAAGTGTGTITAQQVGAAYDQPAGAIIRTGETVRGLDGFQSGELTGGVDRESDKAYFTRIDAHLKRPAASNNVYYYENLARSVPGVGYAVAIPCEDGPGSVGVMVASQDKTPVSQAVLEAVEAAVAAERIVCQNVRVYSAAPLAIRVTAGVMTDGSVTAEEVRETFRAAIGQELSGMELSGKDRTVSYHKLAYLLLSIPGVTDYSVLDLNGGEVSVAVPEKYVPVLETVEVTVG